MAELNDSGISILNHSMNDSVLENENKVNAEVTSDTKMENTKKVNNAQVGGSNDSKDNYREMFEFLRQFRDSMEIKLNESKQDSYNNFEKLNSKFENAEKKFDEFKLTFNKGFEERNKQLDELKLTFNSGFDKLERTLDKGILEFKQGIKEEIAKFDEPLEVSNVSINNTVDNVSKEVEFDDRK